MLKSMYGTFTRILLRIAKSGSERTFEKQAVQERVLGYGRGTLSSRYKRRSFTAS